MKPIIYRKDLKEIHQIFLALTGNYSEKSIRLKYFLAACKYFSQIENFDVDTALKLRPYGRLNGIDNFSWDKYLNCSKILRIHAILHDAGGFIQEKPRLFIYATLSAKQLLEWSCDWNHFLLIHKDLSTKKLSFTGMLSSKSVVLDLEGFRFKKEHFIVKELGVCTEDYNDCVLFSPPSKFRDLSPQQKSSFCWLTKN